MFDVVVIGGNLAGATSAINAAKKGVNVALIERNKEPFSPAHCGEAITDIWAKLLNLDNIDCSKNKINNIMINITSTKEYKLKLKKHKVIIFDRNCVEKEFLKEAEKLGVELKLGIGMTDFNSPHEILLENKQTIKGRIIIDATGIACHIGRRMGMNIKFRPEDVGVCIQSRVQSNFDASTIKTWFHKPYAPFGYAWLFPHDKKNANIGLGVFGGQKLDMVKLLNNYINIVTTGNFKIINIFKACVPIAPPLNRLVKNNVMIVGDAARLVNPVLGCGIRNALFSGRLAGITAASFILGEIPSLKLYQDAMKTEVSRLRKTYIRKRKRENEKKFVRNYQKVFSITCFINKILPDLIQDHLWKIIFNRI